ncbi:MAG: hypothetical protein ACLFN9_05710, partial [Desulfococcaceae bacterium]
MFLVLIFQVAPQPGRHSRPHFEFSSDFLPDLRPAIQNSFNGRNPDPSPFGNFLRIHSQPIPNLLQGLARRNGEIGFETIFFFFWHDQTPFIAMPFTWRFPREIGAGLAKGVCDTPLQRLAPKKTVLLLIVAIFLPQLRFFDFAGGVAGDFAEENFPG